ncbi:sensor histidine kinase [Paenibacillus hamazuiensis]|uniref:sensor histidine kinase n=1 Tax=Paenibacillus hamazuiensis TaxID=2936508 RepID=UPI00200C87C3|nr:ATP-binding protein [Paenibacillus hamazuiensis]
MKQLNKITLRLRLTISTALTLTVICVLLTLSQVITYSATVPATHLNADVHLSLNSTTGTPLSEEKNDFIYWSFVYMLVMIALGTGASYFIAGKALKPVANLSETVKNIDENNLFQPIKSFDTNDEVAQLAASFNHMIMKLEKSFNHQKRFAANAAHELNTPLSSIIANIEVLQMDEHPTVQEYKEVLDDTLAEAQRMSLLVYDLLKMNSSLNRDNCESFDAKTMFDDIIFTVLESSNEKNVRIDNNITDITLFGDKALLQRAFLNLVQNAVKYNEDNGAVIISAVQREESVTVTIEDTGIGIPEGELESVFEPFYRVDTSRSRALGGSGLGLSIVKTIIEKHRGKIEIESELGGFSKITVVLPKK